MKKIMFNDRYELTQAVLEGRKTQTRRIIIPQPTFKDNSGIKRYRKGEVVAVAQSYRDCGGLNEVGVPRWDVISQTVGSTNAGWNNKMFVRANLMPYKIRITDVRIERLQDISDEDCLKEGIRKVVNENGVDVQYYVAHTACFETPREAFAHLIDKVSGKGTWERNPYVWVYDFELVKP